MSRFYWHLYERSDMVSLALLPRIRLTVGSSTGVGFQWLTAWFHFWIRSSNGPTTTMIELLPHVWFHWHPRWGYGVHLWFLRWKGHVWLNRKE